MADAGANVGLELVELILPFKLEELCTLADEDLLLFCSLVLNLDSLFSCTAFICLLKRSTRANDFEQPSTGHL
jgi:hypothetical protein